MRVKESRVAPCEECCCAWYRDAKSEFAGDYTKIDARTKREVEGDYKLPAGRQRSERRTNAKI